MTPVYFDPAQSLVTQLREQGYVNRDIHGLILSHFHADHIAGLRDFSDLTLFALVTVGIKPANCVALQPYGRRLFLA